ELRKYEPTFRTVARIGIGLLFWVHGAQKLLGWFGGFGQDGGTVELMTRFGAAGIIEFFGGLAIILGVLTRPVALILALEMLIAYFWAHVPRGGLWWWANGGERALLYCFVWLYFSTAGAGPFSLDARMAAAAGAGAADPGLGPEPSGGERPGGGAPGPASGGGAPPSSGPSSGESGGGSPGSPST
ncbi:MAG: DoxX family membrane protein, partial [Gemmatimonadetes bacterium]|nr:DoxX family protein [Gemmatimonadota bacterium]NIQ60122.1 DoxX family protein [Gemmatimonadota bacterium]NIU80334.1 DoxX family membrane protein [Gammaproteobacteria bacterium]NIX47881.1 DoxX family membrane protein [Gemmatimonadota bacterium]